MKIVLFGNNLAAVNALREMVKRPDYDIRVVVPATRVVHEWHESLYDYARKCNIEHIYDAEDINNEIFLQEMTDFQPDVFLSIYYDQILGEALLQIPKLGSFNVHPSLLPAYRGTAPLIWAVVNDEKTTGISFHVMERTVDRGDLVLQQAVPIRDSDTGFSLHMRCAEQVRVMMPEFLDRLESGNLKAWPQSGEGSFYRKSDANLNEINWHDSSQRICNIIRALTKPLPGAHTWLRKHKCRIWRVRPVDQNDTVIVDADSYAPGELYVFDNNSRLVVKTGDSWLELLEIGVGGIQFAPRNFIEKLGIVNHDAFFPEARQEVPEPDPESPGQSFIPFGVPSIGEEEIEEVIATLRSGWIGMGNKTMLFEDQFRELTGAKHAVSVSSCTAALHLSLWASEIGPGDEVITTAMTFAATVSAIMLSGAKPVLVDIDPATLNIDINAIEAAITPATRAIVPVHFGGMPCDLAAINTLAEKHGLLVVEDAAHGIGGEYLDQKIGYGRNPACFSFYANKNITTGDGGMIATNNGELAEKLRIMRLHGLSGHAWKRYLSKEIMASMVVLPGFKYNMTDLQASLGIHQLAKVDKWLKQREIYAGVYDEALGELPGFRIQQRDTEYRSRHALHLYVVIVDEKHFDIDRDQLVAELRKLNIGAAIHYPAIHTHPYFQDCLEFDADKLVNAQKTGDRILSLPLTPSMSFDQVRYIADRMRELHQQFYRSQAA